MKFAENYFLTNYVPTPNYFFFTFNSLNNRYEKKFVYVVNIYNNKADQQNILNVFELNVEFKSSFVRIFM